MKRFIIILFLLKSAGTAFGQCQAAKVDERFELTSIVCRLAGASEYMDCRVPEYAENIDRYFKRHSQHPLISYMQEIRNEYGISYDAISSLAYATVIENNKIRIRMTDRWTQLPDSAQLTEIDHRWTKKTLSKYLVLLNDFYRKTHFRHFFESNRLIYATAEKRMDKLIAEIDIKWFENFYGSSFGDPEIYVSITNGPSNFALIDKTDTSRYGILIGCKSRQDGTPDFLENSLVTVIHEFSHRFCNPLAKAYSLDFAPYIECIGPKISHLLYSGAYNSNAIIPEWLTRLGVLMYLREHHPERMKSNIIFDQRVGIIWQKRAVQFMENFYSNRTIYPHFIDFMPQLIGFFQFIVRDFDRVIAEYDNRNPYIINVFPADGSQINMSQDTIKIEVKFSEAMATYCKGYRLLGDSMEELNNISPPSGWKTCEWKDEHTFLLRFKPEWFRIGNIHGLVLIKEFMQNESGYPLAEDFELNFSIQ